MKRSQSPAANEYKVRLGTKQRETRKKEREKEKERIKEITEMNKLVQQRRQRLQEEYNMLYNPNKKIEKFVYNHPKLYKELQREQDYWLNSVGSRFYGGSPFHDGYRGRRVYHYIPSLEDKVEAAKMGERFKWPIANEAWCNSHVECNQPFRNLQESDKQKFIHSLLKDKFHPGISQPLTKYLEEEGDSGPYVQLGPEHFEFNSKRKRKSKRKSKRKRTHVKQSSRKKSKKSVKSKRRVSCKTRKSQKVCNKVKSCKWKKSKGICKSKYLKNKKRGK